MRQAAGLLLAGNAKVVDVGFEAGFESESVFHRQFLALTRMTPGAYRALVQCLPAAASRPATAPRKCWPITPAIRESLCEKSDGNRIWKALHDRGWPGGAGIVAGKGGRVGAGRMPEQKLGRASLAFLHEAALKMLGLNNETAPFETRHAAFAAPRRGLRLPNIPTGFDGLAWGIIGQQINVKFASSLRSEIIRMAGEKIGAMRAHPTPERVANMSVAALNKRRFSRSKAHYLIGAAEAVASGELDIESLPRGSAVAAEKKLTALHGVGTWTARYTMLRGGFADAAPVGDSALATALQRLHKLPERPDQDADCKQLMAAFSPHRSLATMHLWTSLKEAGMKRYWDRIEIAVRHLRRLGGRGGAPAALQLARHRRRQSGSAKPSKTPRRSPKSGARWRNMPAASGRISNWSWISEGPAFQQAGMEGAAATFRSDTPPLMARSPGPSAIPMPPGRWARPMAPIPSP